METPTTTTATTVYEINHTTGERSQAWSGMNADLDHLDKAFGGLAHLHGDRHFEVEQNGQVTAVIGNTDAACLVCTDAECPGDYAHYE